MLRSLADMTGITMQCVCIQHLALPDGFGELGMLRPLADVTTNAIHLQCIYIKYLALV
jgi:hypothetical protein